MFSEAGGTVIRMRLLRCLFLVPLLRGGVSGSLADLSKLLPLSDLPEDLLLLLPPPLQDLEWALSCPFQLGEGMRRLGVAEQSVEELTGGS